MFKSLFRSILGTTTPPKRQVAKPIPAEMSVSPPEVSVEFSDPPFKGGVIYVLSKRRHRIYTVDLNKVTCTCSHFLMSKQCKFRNQVQKYCTHLFQQSRQTGFCRAISPNHELIVEYFHYLDSTGFAVGERFFLHTIDQNDVLIVQKSDTWWVDVLTRKKRAKDSTICTGKIKQYGYSEPGNRWAYGEAPFHPLQIKAFIRSLPSIYDSYSNETEGTPNKFPLQDFLDLDLLQGRAHGDLLDAVLRHLQEINEVDKIASALEKLQETGGIKPKKLAAAWYEHGRNLQSQLHKHAEYFFEMARKLDPNILNTAEANSSILKLLPTRISEESNVEVTLAQFQETEWQDKRKRLSRIDKVLIDVEDEKARFNRSPDAPQKREAQKLLETENPEWYCRDDGHTFRGYLYADFVRSHNGRKKSGPANVVAAIVLDYLASLSIMDGTIADRVMAQMFRVKGEIALERGDKQRALSLLRQAMAYSRNVGVKKIVKRLEAGNKL